MKYIKAFTKENGVIYYLSYSHDSYLKYFHSVEETNIFYCTLWVCKDDRIINSINIPISENSWNNFQKNGCNDIAICYDNINDVILLIQDNIDKTKTILYILICKTLETPFSIKNYSLLKNKVQTIKYLGKDNELYKTNTSKIYMEYESLGKKFMNAVEKSFSQYNKDVFAFEVRLFDYVSNKKNIKVNRSNLGNIVLEYYNDEDFIFKHIYIKNISDEDYSDAITYSPEGLEISRDPIKYDRLKQNRTANIEIKNLLKQHSIFLPYVFFTPGEWFDLCFKYINDDYFFETMENRFNNIIYKEHLKDPTNKIIKELILKKIKEQYYKYLDNQDRIDRRYNSYDWLSDAAGTDDPETLNDVFGNLD